MVSRLGSARVIWLADLLSLSRLPLAVVFWLTATEPAWALAVIGAAALTDALDGRVARYARRRGASRRVEIGGWLDPLCDKIFAVVALVALVVRAETPIALVALVAARDLLVTPLVLLYRLSPWRRRHRVELRASLAGKLTTVAQFVVLVALVVELPGVIVLAVITAVVGVIATAQYVVGAVRVVRAPAAPAGG